MQCRIRLSFEKRTYIYFCSNDIAHTSSLNHSYVEDAKNATSEKTMCVNDMQSEFISKVSAGVMTSVGLSECTWCFRSCGSRNVGLDGSSSEWNLVGRRTRISAVQKKCREEAIS